MKFRCERDVLADALATAGRAATSRTGTLPVLVRSAPRGRRATSSSVTGTDLELSIRLTITVGGERDGAVVVPARLVADIVRSLPAGAVEVERRRTTTRQHQRRPVAVLDPRRSALDDYPAQVEPAAEAVTLSSAAFADALRQVVRAASTDEARAVLTGVLIAAEDDGVRHGRHRLVPPRRARPARAPRCWRRPEGAGAAAGRSASCSALLGGERASSRCASARATRRSRSARTRLTTAADRGRVPELPQPGAVVVPERAHRRQEALLEALRRVKILAQDATPGAPQARRRHADAVGASPRTSATRRRRSTPPTRAPR